MPDGAIRCVDCSAAVLAAIRDGVWFQHALQLFQDSTRDGIILMVPFSFFYDVENRLHQLFLMPEADGGFGFNEEAFDKAMQWLRNIIQIDRDATLAARARQIARKYKWPLIGEAWCTALAEKKQCELWTGNEDFFAAVSQDLNFVKFIANYPIY